MRFFLSTVLLFALFLVQAVPARAVLVSGDTIMDQRMSENLCALTFDDGPSRYTADLLDMLDFYGIPATFFILGNQAVQRPELVRRMVESGHEIGNHTFSHKNLRILPYGQKQEEISRAFNILQELDAKPKYLRPPYGSLDPSVVEIAEKLGMATILWSMDSHDWKGLPADHAKVYSTRGTIYADGTLRGVFLFHDTHKTTVDDLPRIVRQLKAGGCTKFVTVSEYLDGILDPEPAVLMTRRGGRPSATVAVAGKKADLPGQADASRDSSTGIMPNMAWPAGTAAVPLARCSRPHTAGQMAPALLFVPHS